MSVVIVGGNDRMVCQYKDLCKQYDCDAKVFTQMPGTLKKKIGSPDVMILFTSTRFPQHDFLCGQRSQANQNKNCSLSQQQHGRFEKYFARNCIN